MTFRLVLASALAAMAVSACATGSGPSSYNQELTQLTADCAERGGILVPNGNASTGRPATDYSCRISGGASRIN